VGSVFHTAKITLYNEGAVIIVTAVLKTIGLLSTVALENLK
jgi:hypothetical protein